MPLGQGVQFEAWLKLQEEDLLEVFREKLKVLMHFGPQLGRPLVGTLKESKHKNMKELRIKSRGSVVRIFFIFDPQRKIVFLLGAEKQGVKGFYKKMIHKVDKIYQKYLESEYEK